MNDPITMKEIRQALLELRKYTLGSSPQEARLDALISRINENVKFLDHKNPEWAELKKPILCVDFDGVIHEYKSGWKGANVIEDEPMPGAFAFLRQAVIHFKVLIYSTRCNDEAGIYAMMNWFVRKGLELDVLNQLIFEPGKPSWFLHIDDRAYQFKGAWPNAEGLLSFKPWYYSHPDWRRDKD